MTTSGGDADVRSARERDDGRPTVANARQRAHARARVRASAAAAPKAR